MSEQAELDDDEITADFDKIREGYEISAAEAKHLRLEILADSRNQAARLKLLGYDEKRKNINKYYENLSWFVVNYPQKGFFEFATLMPGDNEAYDRTKRRWLSQLRRQPTDTRILCNYATFCSISSWKKSVKYLKKASKIAPTSEDISYRLAFALKLLAHNKTSAKEAVVAIFHSVKLYERPTQTRSYLFQYFEMVLNQFAELALDFGLLEESEQLARILLKRKVLDAKRLGAQRAESAYNYSNFCGYSILGQIAIAKNNHRKANYYLHKLCAAPITYFSDTKLAEKLYKSGERKLVLKYVENLADGWRRSLDALEPDSQLSSTKFTNSKISSTKAIQFFSELSDKIRSDKEISTRFWHKNYQE